MRNVFVTDMAKLELHNPSILRLHEKPYSKGCPNEVLLFNGHRRSMWRSETVELDGGDGCINNVNIPNANKLHTTK